ncbi:MAG TPA: hypothetical protein VKT77_15220 [Chthonomonadaceae bacterium]|nr:hypothetical protein [Chthonomonadaceae bacterium]
MSGEFDSVEALAGRVAEGDVLAVVERIVAESEPLDAARRLHGLGNHLYWKVKDLPGSVAALRAAAQHGLTAAEGDPERRNALRSEAKGACYDIASFTWPGWDEPGIEISASDIAVGYDAARTNLRLAQELEKGDLPLSRGHWMLAGQALARLSHDEAIEHYGHGARFAEAAGVEAERLLCKGFASLAGLVAHPEDGGAEARVRSALSGLASLEGGKFFADQIQAAARVFGCTLE